MEIKEIMIDVAMLNRMTIAYGNKCIIIQLLILNDLRLAKTYRSMEVLICIIHKE